MYLGVFYGPRASKHLNPGSSGRRSKAFKNDMTRVTKASIAYIAMLVCHVVHIALPLLMLNDLKASFLPSSE